MFNRVQRIRIAAICLVSLALNPSWAREGGGGGGGFRGGAQGRRVGGPAGGGGAPHPGPGAGAPHAGGAGIPHGGPAPHGGAPMHGENHFSGGPHGGPGIHSERMLHQPGPHWNSYHQAYVGNRPVHLAWAGYRPSYYYHPWYHGPWGGHAWGWGWGFGPGLTFGLAAGGLGIGASWGYPVYYNPYGPYGYWGRPLGWGFGGWGLGTTVYSSGYYSYYNPYYYPPAYPVVVYDYSRPIQVATQAPPGAPAGGYPPAATGVTGVTGAYPAPPSTGSSTLYDSTSSPNVGTSSNYAAGSSSASQPSAPPLDNPAFDAARESFLRGEYATALTNVDAAIRKAPTDAVMHEFRCLALFALRDYRQSAAVAHSILAVGPGWDYTTMCSLYSDPAIYATQLRHLEDYAHEHPRAAEAHFLLAYHNMIGSHKEAAAAELQQVIKLLPSDRLAAELLTMVQGPPKQPQNNPGPSNPPDTLSGNPNPLPPTEVAEAPTLPPVDKNLLPGTWNASRPDGSKFRLTLTADGQFSWKFSLPNQKGDEFAGTYTTDGPMLVLERKEGGALAGTAKFDGDGKMNFKLVGGPPDDQGLDFGRF